MYQAHRKITASGLLLLLAIPLFFTVGIIVKQKIIRYQRDKRLDTELLQTVTVSVENLLWIKPRKEILLDGKLFDVKSFKTEGNKISLTGFFDSEEDELVENIKDLVHQKNRSDAPFSQMALKFLLAPVYSDPSIFSFQDSWRIITRQFSTCRKEMAVTGFGLAPIHPPEYC